MLFYWETDLCDLYAKLARSTLKTPKAAYRTLRKAVGTKQGVAGLTPWPFFVEGRACGTQQIMVMYTFILVCLVCNKLARTLFMLRVLLYENTGKLTACGALFMLFMQ